MNPQCKVISTPTFLARTEGAANQMKEALMSHLSEVKYVVAQLTG